LHSPFPRSSSSSLFFPPSLFVSSLSCSKFPFLTQLRFTSSLQRQEQRKQLHGWKKKYREVTRRSTIFCYSHLWCPFLCKKGVSPIFIEREDEARISRREIKFT
jgi:hypothetical protein